MITQYEKDRQVQSVIARYHREAADANRLAPLDGRTAPGAPLAMRSLRQRFGDLVHGARRAHERASTAASHPASALHLPK